MANLQSGQMFKRVLIANRGEIAVRITRTCRTLGIHSIAVYSDADAGAMHVREADSAEYIGPSPAAESYLNVDAILGAAERSRAEAIHPGYGFLSENAGFAEACAEAGLVFVGPSPEAIRAMGDKVQARRLMAAAGVPVIPGYDGDDGRPKAVARTIEEIGYPLMVKAAAGGGGRGMRIVRAPQDLNDALESASRESQAAFGDGRIFIEKLIEGGRHIEAQVFGDHTGRVVFVGERECSIQRRHQKVIEECPSPAVDEPLRERLAAAAVKAGEAVGYTNAGTVEFLFAPDNSFYFLEMNTRLQVEHPVTEEVYGIDMVEWQLSVAAGECLPPVPAPSGHAIEFRVYAEDPANDFLPSPGIVDVLEIPADGRWDSGYEAGDEVPYEYDPLLGKLVVTAEDRDGALRLARFRLGGILVRGPTTNIELLRSLASHPKIVAGDFDVGWLQQALGASDLSLAAPIQAVLAAAAGDLAADGVWTGAWRQAGARGLVSYSLDGNPIDVWYESQRYGQYTVTIGEHSRLLAEVEAQDTSVTYRLDGERHQADVSDRGAFLAVTVDGRVYAVERRRPNRGVGGPARPSGHGEAVKSPLPGIIVKLLVTSGDAVQARQAVAVLEAMKMEHQLNAPIDGIVEEVFVSEGQRVEEGAVILSLAVPGAETESGTGSPA